MPELFYHLQDLATVPDKFLDDFVSRLNDPRRSDTSLNHTRPEYVSRLLTNGQWTKNSTRSQRFDTAEDFKSWVADNITDTWTECSISSTEVNLGDMHGAHTDWSRHWVLIYVIDPGGDHCRTVWYQQHDNSIVRTDLGCYVTDYTLLRELGDVRMAKHNWYAINSQILHGVESLTQDRITVQIGLWDLNTVKSKLFT